MKIHAASNLKLLDQRTMKVQNISSWELMERAASSLFSAIQNDFDISDTHFTIMCGPGNNGGDGLALARMLYHAGSEIEVYIAPASKFTDDNLENQKRLLFTEIKMLDFERPPTLREGTVVIDAFYGYGLSRPLESKWSLLFEHIKKYQTISVDLPSGLIPDRSTPAGSPIITAHIVYTFQSPKAALLQPENGDYVKSFKILNINLEDTVDSKNYYLTLKFIQSLLKSESRFSHKGTFGHALIIGGSYGKIGAPLLSSMSALKTGCGLVSTYIPRCGYTPFQSAFPEAMVISDPAEEQITDLKGINTNLYNAIGVGVGLGQEVTTQNTFTDFLQQTTLPPLVIDADALNLISSNKNLLEYLPQNTILTPHPKELQRLIGPWKNDFDKLDRVRNLATKYKIIVIIKGANSAIVLPDGRIYYNSTGNYGMATGGSGDVLTGIITSLLAQSYTPENAAILGVYLHGLSGDIAVQTIHPKSLISSDIIHHISAAWKVVNL